MYIVNGFNGNVWDKVECATLEDAINEAKDRWYHLTDRERQATQVFNIEHEGDVVFDFLKLHTYAIVECVMGMDFIEVDTDNVDDAVGMTMEWFKERFENVDWEWAYIVRCPAWMDDDGEIEPDTSNYKEWIDLDIDEIREEI